MILFVFLSPTAQIEFILFPTREVSNVCLLAAAAAQRDAKLKSHQLLHRKRGAEAADGRASASASREANRRTLPLQLLLQSPRPYAQSAPEAAGKVVKVENGGGGGEGGLGG